MTDQTAQVSEIFNEMQAKIERLETSLDIAYARVEELEDELDCLYQDMAEESI
jgi:hypothetical protein